MTGQEDLRFLLWVDAVGAFLVCGGERIVLGHAAPGNPIDIPLQANLGSRHATICRDREGYLLIADSEARIDGRSVCGAATLSPGCVIELGSGVRLRFTRPHPLSATALLVPLSNHRTQPLVDGVVLLADSCVLGPSANCHVVARNWTRDVLLFRQSGSLHCRTTGSLEIDNVVYRGEGPLGPNSRVSGNDFSLSLERIP